MSQEHESNNRRNISDDKFVTENYIQTHNKVLEKEI